MTNYTKKALTSAIMIFSISLAAAAFGYLVRIYFARNLSVEEFGLFYAVISFLGLIGVLRGLGFDRALVTFISKFHAKNEYVKIKTTILYSAAILFLTNLVSIILIFILADFLGINYFHDSFASSILKLMAISFFIDNFTYIIKFCFQGFQKMGLFSSIDFVRMVIIFVISFIGFELGLKLMSPVLAYILTPILLLLIYCTIFIWKVFPRFSKIKFKKDKKLFWGMIHYSYHLILITTIGTSFRYTDSVILTYFKGVRDVGIYNAVLPTAMLLWYLPMALNNVVWPMTSEFINKGKLKELKDGIGLLYKYSLIVMLPLALLIFVFSGTILELLYGPEYGAGKLALQILIFGMVLFAFYAINVGVFYGMGKPQINTITILIGSALSVILNIILIPDYGIAGAAFAASISYIPMVLIGLYHLKREKLLSIPYTGWLKTLIASIIFLLVVYFLNMNLSLNIYLKIPLIFLISGIVYFVLIFAFRIVTLDEIKELVGRVKVGK